MDRIKTKEIPEVKAILLAEQDGFCGICGHPLWELPEKDACLDHDHQTGAVRGVLCRNCNSIEGRIHHYTRRACRKRTPLAWLKKLVQYLELHSENQTGIIHSSYRTFGEKNLLKNKRARKKRKLRK